MYRWLWLHSCSLQLYRVHMHYFHIATLSHRLVQTIATFCSYTVQCGVLEGSVSIGAVIVQRAPQTTVRQCGQELYVAGVHRTD